MLYAALSCYEGEISDVALLKLLGLHHKIGVQLTPGCIPSLTMPNMVQAFYVVGYRPPLRTHHGYYAGGTRRNVWTRDGKLCWSGDSVHPPLMKHVQEGWLPPDDFPISLETMYPGYAFMNDGDSIMRAMDMGLKIAVDCAHLDMQLYAGVLTRSQLDRICAYSNVTEIHVSKSLGKNDSHHAMLGDEWFNAWANERGFSGCAVIIESYLRKLNREQTYEQVTCFERCLM